MRYVLIMLGSALLNFGIISALVTICGAKSIDLRTSLVLCFAGATIGTVIRILLDDKCD